MRNSNKFSEKLNYVLAGNPRRWPLIFSAVGDYAFFTARDEFENDLFAPVQAGPFVILGGGQDQPVSSQNRIGPVDGKDLITPIRIHFQRWSRAMLELPVDFHAHAVISSGEIGLCLRRCAAEDKSCTANDEKFNEDVKQSVMISHSGPQAPWIRAI